MNQSRNYNVTFREIQQFRQKWIWALLLLVDLSIIIPFGYGMFKQLMLGQTWGNQPMSDTAIAIVGIVSIIFMGGFTYLFYVLKLIIEVRDDGLYIQFFPFSRQLISFDNIKTCEVRTYRPIKEYGGWGIRYGKKGKAYNISGNKGVQLDFYKGKPLLIGSQKPEKLAQAIKIGMKE